MHAIQPQTRQTALPKDPICGMAVTEQSFHHAERDGQVYYFCGAKCKGRFMAQSGLTLDGSEVRSALSKAFLPVLRKVQPLWWFLLCVGLLTTVMVVRQIV
ncbi:MAG: YHS domain-containing protein [Rhodoferax sp.]|nr:YHS domain-containing protein [Rhodoferax sp.]